jgi:hypothetical protein
MFVSYDSHKSETNMLSEAFDSCGSYSNDVVLRVMRPWPPLQSMLEMIERRED